MPNGINPCNWPDTRTLTAAEMLDEIAARAEPVPPEEMDPAVKIRILDRAYQCKSRYLRNEAGKHVCGLTEPDAICELLGIWQRTAPEYVEQQPDKPQHWATIATELESFPTGT